MAGAFCLKLFCRSVKVRPLSNPSSKTCEVATVVRPPVSLGCGRCPGLTLRPSLPPGLGPGRGQDSVALWQVVSLWQVVGVRRVAVPGVYAARGRPRLDVGRGEGRLRRGAGQPMVSGVWSDFYLRAVVRARGRPEGVGV